MASTTEPGGENEEVSGDVFTATLSYKIWVLKVSLHCEACGKNVSKLLKEIDGVYKTQVELAKQRVTVIGNVEAEAMIKILKKKTSKRFVVIWPEPQANPRDEVQSRPQAQERQSAPAAVVSVEPKPSQGGGGGGGAGDRSRGKQVEKGEVVKGEVVEVKERGGGVTERNYEVGSSSNSKNVVLEGQVVKPHEGRGSCGGGIKIREPQTGNLPRQSPPPVVAEKQSGAGENAAVEVKSGDADGNGGGSGKKKGNEQNVNVADGQPGGVAPSTGSPPVQTVPLPQPQPQPQGHPNVQTTMPAGVQRAMPVPPYHVPQPQPQVYDHSNNPRQQHEHLQPRQQQQQYEYYQPMQQQQYGFSQPRQEQYEENPWARQQQQYFTPMPAMNYHAAYPSASYVARQDAQPAYSATHTYAHWGLGNEVTPEASQLDSLPAELPSFHPQPYHAYGSSDTFAWFSDENTSACSIM